MNSYQPSLWKEDWSLGDISLNSQLYPNFPWELEQVRQSLFKNSPVVKLNLKCIISLSLSQWLGIILPSLQCIEQQISSLYSS